MSCQNCLTRIPYATCIATLLCVVGVSIFSGTIFRGAALSRLIFEDVFHVGAEWISITQLVFVIVGGVMGVLALLILCVGCFSTGETKHRMYSTGGARVGGRVTCLIFIILAYILNVLWLAMLVFLTGVTVVFTFWWGMCANKQKRPEKQCISFTEFDFLFPNGTRIEDMEVCGPEEIKLFCKDYVENGEIMFILATSACGLVVFSLIHYLMCLSANYAYIRDQEKLHDLEDLRYLHSESEMTALAGKRY